MSDSDFRRALTPPYAKLDADRDPRNALVDMLTIQLGNAVVENRRLTRQIAQYQLDDIQGGATTKGATP